MKIRIEDHVKLDAAKMAKIALATTERAQLDLYCVAPGQSQKPHTHGDQDKIYYVLEGAGRFSLAGKDERVAAEAASAQSETRLADSHFDRGMIFRASSSAGGGSDHDLVLIRPEGQGARRGISTFNHDRFPSLGIGRKHHGFVDHLSSESLYVEPGEINRVGAFNRPDGAVCVCGGGDVFDVHSM